jgi:predicted RNA-binding protein
METKFWIVTISEDNLELAISHNLIGLPARRNYYVQLMAEGDIVVFYIGKKRSGYYDRQGIVANFGPIARIVGQPLYDETRIWKSRFGEIYPWRRKISIILNKQISARNIIKELSFVRNQSRWGFYLIRGVRKITAEDYKMIFNALDSN